MLVHTLRTSLVPVSHPKLVHARRTTARQTNTTHPLLPQNHLNHALVGSAYGDAGAEVGSHRQVAVAAAAASSQSSNIDNLDGLGISDGEQADPKRQKAAKPLPSSSASPGQLPAAPAAHAAPATSSAPATLAAPAAPTEPAAPAGPETPAAPAAPAASAAPAEPAAPAVATDIVDEADLD